MKKHLITSLLVSSCFIFLSTSLPAQATHLALLSGTTPTSTAMEKARSNERKVLLSINQYIAEHLEDMPELMSYYNADLEFTISLEITEKGYIEQVTSSAPCKSPIASALIVELEKLEKVEPIVKDGKAVKRQYRIPIRLQSR